MDELLKAIDNQQKRMENLVETWVNFPSYSKKPTDLNRLAKQLLLDFSSLGDYKKLVSIPTKTTLTKQGIIQERLGKALVIKKTRKNKPHIFLGGHMDTVYADPRFILSKTATIWNGPGVTDMKGGLAVLLIALEAFEKTPFKDNLSWEVLINPDEEIGSPGSYSLLEQCANRADAALIFEPCFPNGALVKSRKGSMTFTVVCTGKAAHVGRDFSAGKNAISAMNEFCAMIENELSTPHCFVNLGFIEGGGPVNQVADHVLMRFNLRFSAPENEDTLLEKVEKIKEIIEKKTGTAFILNSDTIRSPKPLNQSTDKWLQIYGEISSDLKLPYSLVDTGGVCDGNIFAKKEIPVIDSLGVLGGCLHTQEEFLEVFSLSKKAQATFLLLCRMAHELV